MPHFIAQLTAPTRLDRLLRTHFPDWGRQTVDQWIASRKVKVNGRPVWLSSWQVNNGDRVEVSALPLPEKRATKEPTKSADFTHFDDSWLIADDGEILAVNKPAGLLSEPTRDPNSVNLRDLAIARFGPLILFHRLDRDTSGVILLTRPGPINKALDDAFKNHQVQKEYFAVVHAPNQLQPNGIIDLRLDQDPTRRDKMVVVAKGGQRAITRYEIVSNANAQLQDLRQTRCDGFDKLSHRISSGVSPKRSTLNAQLVKLYPQTGRQHQLRVHLAHFGAPLLGDRLYGDGQAAERLMLHAHQLIVRLREGEQEKVYRAPLPAAFYNR